MIQTVVYVLSESYYDPRTRQAVVTQLAAFETPKDAIEFVEAIYERGAGGAGYKEGWTLERDTKETSFEAAWWVTEKKTGQKFRLDVGARDAFIGSEDLGDAQVVA